MHSCFSYLRHGTAQNKRVSRLSQLLHSISHCPAAVVGTWPKVFVPPVPSTTTPTYAVTSLTHTVAAALQQRRRGKRAPCRMGDGCCGNALCRFHALGQRFMPFPRTEPANQGPKMWQVCTAHQRLHLLDSQVHQVTDHGAALNVPWERSRTSLRVLSWNKPAAHTPAWQDSKHMWRVWWSALAQGLRGRKMTAPGSCSSSTRLSAKHYSMRQRPGCMH
jgi:hypothetical protein